MASCSCPLLQQLETKRISIEPARQALLKCAWMTPVPAEVLMAELYPGRCYWCHRHWLYRHAADGLRGAARKINNYSDNRCIKYRKDRRTMWLVVPVSIAEHLAAARELAVRRKLRWL